MFENMQVFFESTQGQVVSVGVFVVAFIGVLAARRGEKSDIKAIILSALLVSLAVVLGQITLFQMPQGGSITPFGMLPIVACAYFFGTRRAIMCGICVGMVDMIFKPYVIHPVQMLLDYPLAFGAIGFAGIVFMIKKDAFIPAFIVGVLGRYIASVLSGTIFFGMYAPEGFSGLTWSLYYNMTYLGAEAAITVVVLCVPAVKNLFKTLKSKLNVEVTQREVIN